MCSTASIDVCFDVFRRSWRETCIPLIGINGFFYERNKMLVALGRDADNAIYLIYWGCCSRGEHPNLVVVLKHVKADLSLGDGDGYIMVSQGEFMVI